MSGIHTVPFFTSDNTQSICDHLRNRDEEVSFVLNTLNKLRYSYASIRFDILHCFDYIFLFLAGNVVRNGSLGSRSCNFETFIKGFNGNWKIDNKFEFLKKALKLFFEHTYGTICILVITEKHGLVRDLNAFCSINYDSKHINIYLYKKILTQTTRTRSDRGRILWNKWEIRQKGKENLE